jgi:hypothetical protein
LQDSIHDEPLECVRQSDQGGDAIVGIAAEKITCARRRGHDADAVRTEYAHDFAPQGVWLLDMLERLEQQHDVECTVVKRQRRAIAHGAEDGQRENGPKRQEMHVRDEVECVHLGLTKVGERETRPPVARADVEHVDARQTAQRLLLQQVCEQRQTSVETARCEFQLCAKVRRLRREVGGEVTRDGGHERLAQVVPPGVQGSIPGRLGSDHQRR